MFKQTSLKKKSVKEALLADELEGGGADGKMLSKLPAAGKHSSINDEAEKPNQGARRQSRSKSKATDETQIEGLE